MNKTKQKIAIAEACGYRPATPGALGVLRWHDPHHQNGDLGNGICYIDDIPDYLNDLNAMHEAEKVFTIEQQRHYAEELGRSYDGSFLHVTASADQRAKALLKALDLWKEEA